MRIKPSIFNLILIGLFCIGSGIMAMKMPVTKSTLSPTTFASPTPPLPPLPPVEILAENAGEPTISTQNTATTVVVPPFNTDSNFWVILEGQRWDNGIFTFEVYLSEPGIIQASTDLNTFYDAIDSNTCPNIVGYTKTDSAVFFRGRKK